MERPLRRLPALCRLPGHSPAQGARCAAEGKRVMSVPISATMVLAAVSVPPGMVCSSATASAKGVWAASISAVYCASWASKKSRCARMWRRSSRC